MIAPVETEHPPHPARKGLLEPAMKIAVRRPTLVNTAENTPAAHWPLREVIDVPTWGEAWAHAGATPVNANGVGQTPDGGLVYLDRLPR